MVHAYAEQLEKKQKAASSALKVTLVAMDCLFLGACLVSAFENTCPDHKFVVDTVSEAHTGGGRMQSVLSGSDASHLRP